MCARSSWLASGRTGAPSRKSHKLCRTFDRSTKYIGTLNCSPSEAMSMMEDEQFELLLLSARCSAVSQHMLSLHEVILNMVWYTPGIQGCNSCKSQLKAKGLLHGQRHTRPRLPTRSPINTCTKPLVNMLPSVFLSWSSPRTACTQNDRPNKSSSLLEGHASRDTPRPSSQCGTLNFTSRSK